MQDHLPWFVVWDRAVFLYLNHIFRSPFMDMVMPWITQMGLGGNQAAAVLLLAILHGAVHHQVHFKTLWADIKRSVYMQRTWVSPLLLCFLIGGLGADAIKIMIPRDRPWWYYGNQHLEGHLLNSIVCTVKGVYPLKVHGFPSGHTSTSFAMAMVVSLIFGRDKTYITLGIWILAFLIAFSRIYLGSHWPLDILGGMVIGCISGFVSVRICQKDAQRRAQKCKHPD
jgi:membrane-associated phospholipid phosphatase